MSKSPAMEFDGATPARIRPSNESAGVGFWSKSLRWTSRVLIVVLALLYAWFRYTAQGMERSHFAANNVRRVAYGNLVTFQSGDETGRPIIFVHGTPGAADNWRRFLAQPRPGFWCIAVDRPGFGDSTPRKGLARLPEQAAALKPLLEALRGRNPILVGHSLGGPIIAQAALDFPDLAGGLVMVAASMDPSVEKVFAIQYLGDLPGLRHVIPRFLRNSNRELIPLREDLEALFPRLNALTCPVAIVHGTADVLVPFENVAYMKAAFSPALVKDIVVLEGENHFLPWSAEESVWRAVDDIEPAAP